MIKINNKKVINAPISIGEIFDKITILEIKKEKLKNEKLINVNLELKLLKKIVNDNGLNVDKKLINNLREVNNKLWNIEDKIRKKEKLKTFDNEFIEIARSVYIENDKRSEIKREINTKYNSELVEEKSY
tara:strand:- start:293 stop:682 length:390 start_codon:yes stop_codon:yes gene_type:complete